MKLPCSGLWKVVRNYKQEVSVKTDASFFIPYNVLKSIYKFAYSILFSPLILHILSVIMHKLYKIMKKLGFFMHFFTLLF